MTQPVGGQLAIGAQLVPHPQDPAKACVALILSAGPLQTTLAPMSPEEADQLAEGIRGALVNRAAEARRHNLGLVVPGNGHGGAPNGHTVPMPQVGNLPPLPGL